MEDPYVAIGAGWKRRHTKYALDTKRLNRPQVTHTWRFCASSTPDSTKILGSVIAHAPVLPNGTTNGRSVSFSMYLRRRNAKNSSSSVRL